MIFFNSLKKILEDHQKLSICWPFLLFLGRKHDTNFMSYGYVLESSIASCDNCPEKEVIFLQRIVILVSSVDVSDPCM